VHLIDRATECRSLVECVGELNLCSFQVCSLLAPLDLPLDGVEKREEAAVLLLPPSNHFISIWGRNNRHNKQTFHQRRKGGSARPRHKGELSNNNNSSNIKARISKRRESKAKKARDEEMPRVDWREIKQ
jgi:aminopeptidase N